MVGNYERTLNTNQTYQISIWFEFNFFFSLAPTYSLLFFYVFVFSNAFTNRMNGTCIVLIYPRF